MTDHLARHAAMKTIRESVVELEAARGSVKSRQSSVALALAVILLSMTAPGRAADRTTRSEGSRPKILINWWSFEDQEFPSNWKIRFQNVVIKGYTWKSHHEPFFGDLTDLRALYRVLIANDPGQLATYDGGGLGDCLSRIASPITETPWEPQPTGLLSPATRS